MRKWFGRAAVAIGIGCVAPSLVGAQITIVPDPSRTISVTGRAAISVVPDTATVRLGVVARDTALPKAKATVDGVMQRLIGLAEHLHVAEPEVETSSLNIVPQYGEDAARPFLGYDVTRSVTITLHELGRLEQLLDGAIEAGANRDFDVSLSSSREAQLKQEALAKAIGDGRRQAEFAAEKLGLRVGGVRGISLNRASGVLSTSTSYSGSYARFLPGQISVDAEASITFFLEDGGEASRK